MILNFDLPRAPSMTLDKLLRSGSIAPNSCYITGNPYGRRTVCTRKLSCLEGQGGSWEFE